MQSQISRAVILPISRLMDLRGDDSSVVFDRDERLEIGMYSVVTKLVGVKTLIFIISSKRTRFGNAYLY